MPADAKKFRMELRKFVRQAWLSDTGAELQDALRKIAREKIEKGYEECARSATPIVDCYKKVAQEANLADAYREIWGTK